jgi:GT2 family glycosyltransferase
MIKNAIFIQIASYRDQQLIPTLLDLIGRAAHPELLRIVVCWQHAEDETIAGFIDSGFVLEESSSVASDILHILRCRQAHITLIDIPYLQTQGACWARNKIQQHYRAEKYTLQLDSHHRFVQDWDALLIAMLESLREQSPKPLLTTYLPGFDPEREPDGREDTPRKIRFRRFAEEGVVMLKSAPMDNWKACSQPVRARFYSGHFAFADGCFATEVQHDPAYFFHGEEISIGVRAFTHGYDLYHPHRVVAWHQYWRKDHVKVWHDHSSARKAAGEIAQDWRERDSNSLRRNRHLFGMEPGSGGAVDFGKYGFGTARSVRQFELYAGISFKLRGVTSPLPILDTDSHMENSIFIQIASYRDPQLIPTLLDLIGHAAHPELLRIVVCWQHAEDERLEDFSSNGFAVIGNTSSVGNSLHLLQYQQAKIELIPVSYLKTQGACWARHKIQQHYQGEKYTLQLDSHHRFVEHWDSLLTGMLESLRADGVPKPLLTSYLPAFDPDNDPAGRSPAPTRLDFDRFIPESAVFFLPASIKDWEQRERPLPARFYSAHFAFADGSFAVEVQHDPEYFFHGEEISIGVRAFTHGYDLYHPHRLVAWHEYTRKGRVKVWDDHTQEKKDEGSITADWCERNTKCHDRNKILFGMDGADPAQIDFGKYGFGSKRTLQEFEKYAGVSFKYRGVRQTVIDRQEPSLAAPGFESEEAWRNSLKRSNDIRICVHKNDLVPLLDDYDFWYVGCHDQHGRECHRQDLDEQQVRTHLQDDWIDYRFIFLGDIDMIPKTYTIWPHSKSQGWLTKIDRTIDS